MTEPIAVPHLRSRSVEPREPGEPREPREREPAPRAGILLPPGWVTVVLTSPHARAAGIREVMARQFNATPASPALRHQMVASLNGVMANAVKVGGTLMAFHLLRPRGVPMPMTLTVFRPIKPASMAAVIAANAGRDDAVTATHADGRAIVRRAGATSSRLDRDSEPVAQLQAEYWLDPQDGAGLYHAVFTTPLLEQSDALLEMFDAIVSTVRVV